MGKYKFHEIGSKEEFEMVRGKYPELPKSILVKADLCRRGERFTDKVMEVFSDPEQNIITTSVALFKNNKADEPTSSPGYYPGYFRLNDGTLVMAQLAPKENDPYIIDKVNGDYFALFNDGTPLAQINFVKRPKYYGKTTSSGVPMELVAFTSSRCMMLYVPTSYCRYWKDGKQCVFCDIVQNAAYQRKKGWKFEIRRSPQEFYETTKEALKEKGAFKRILITGGADPRDNYRSEFGFELELIKAIQQAGRECGHERIPIYLIASPLEPEWMLELKEAGLSGFGSYIEVWDREKFENSCPGKATAIGWDTILERSLKAVKIFGRGNVCYGFVIGLEMAPEPYGFGDDMEAALASTLSGYEFLLKNGIALIGTDINIIPGTTLYKMGMTPPPLEFYARLELGRLDLLKTYGIATKLHDWRSQPYGLYADTCRYV